MSDKRIIATWPFHYATKHNVSEKELDKAHSPEELSSEFEVLYHHYIVKRSIKVREVELARSFKNSSTHFMLSHVVGLKL